MKQITEQEKNQAAWVILSAVAYARLLECGIGAMLTNRRIKVQGAEKMTINALKKQIEAFLYKYKGIDDLLLHEDIGLLSVLEVVIENLSTPEKASKFATFVVAYDKGDIKVED